MFGQNQHNNHSLTAFAQRVAEAGEDIMKFKKKQTSCGLNRLELVASDGSFLSRQDLERDLNDRIKALLSVSSSLRESDSACEDGELEVFFSHPGSVRDLPREAVEPIGGKFSLGRMVDRVDTSTLDGFMEKVEEL